MRRKAVEDGYQYSAVLDLDGFLFDFEGEFCKRFGDDHRDFTRLQDRYPDRKDEITRFIQNPDTYKRLFVLPVGQKIARYLWDQKVMVHIMTSRPFTARDNTIKSLSNADIRWDTFEMRKDKPLHINGIGPDLVADDIISVLEQCNAPLRILMKQTYNETPFFPRISSVDQFIELWERFVHENVPNHSRRVRMADHLSAHPPTV
jgi:hypothetical protein